uniref:Galaxin-like repeats domain-containing protein n=1 Tax=Ciona savignyi TaxID=51511 RepID=H2ZBJ2_CIOSA
MKLYIALLAIAAAAVVQGQEGTPPPPSVPPPVGATLIPPARCKRAIQTCAVFDPSTNETTDVDYDHCLQFCCGSAVVDRSTDVVCCGNEVVGVPYNTVTQVCCNYNHQYAAHDLADGGDFCCGLNAYNNTARDLGCCVGYPGDPQMFNVFTEMCCENVPTASPAGNSSVCCGIVGMDPSTDICCDGVVTPLGGVPAPAMCCDGAAQPMTSDADVCCGPDSMNPAVSFCCGGAVSSMEGLTSDQMLCCDGVAFTNAAGNLACCGQVSFNTETEICCSDVVLPLGTTDPANAYCCGGAVIDMTDYWCCDNNPYPRGSSAAPPIGQNCNI